MKRTPRTAPASHPPVQVSRLLQLGFALLQQRRQLVSHLADLRDALPDQLGLQGLEGIGYLGYA